jgi:hypothetical protein
MRMLRAQSVVVIVAEGKLPFGSSGRNGLEIGSSVPWPVIGALQLTGRRALRLRRRVVRDLFVSGGAVPVGTVDAPWLGPIRIALALLVGAVVVSALLGWILSLHARLVGDRIARRVELQTVDEVTRAISDVALAGLLRVEDARRTMAAAA